MRQMRKPFLLTLALLVFSACLYSGYWYLSAYEAEKLILKTMKNWREEKHEVEFSSITKTNFPFRPTITLESLSFAHHSQGWFGYIGNVQINSGFLGLSSERKAEITDGSLTLADGRIFSSSKITIETNLSSPETIFDQSFAEIEAQQIDLPFNLGLSERIDALNLRLKQDKDLSLPFTVTNLEKWRDNGGAWQVENFNIQQQDLQLGGNLTFAFDQNMQTLAAGVLSARGIDRMIDQLAKSDQIKPALALLLKQILTQAQNSNGEITSAFSIQDQYLYWNGQRILKLSPIRWP